MEGIIGWLEREGRAREDPCCKREMGDNLMVVECRGDRTGWRSAGWRGRFLFCLEGGNGGWADSGRWLGLCKRGRSISGDGQRAVLCSGRIGMARGRR